MTHHNELPLSTAKGRLDLRVPKVAAFSIWTREPVNISQKIKTDEPLQGTRALGGSFSGKRSDGVNECELFVSTVTMHREFQGMGEEGKKGGMKLGTYMRIPAMPPRTGDS